MNKKQYNTLHDIVVQGIEHVTYKHKVYSDLCTMEFNSHTTTQSFLFREYSLYRDALALVLYFHESES